MTKIVDGNSSGDILEQEAIVWHNHVTCEKMDVKTLIAFEEWINTSLEHRKQYEDIKSFHQQTEVFLDEMASSEEVTLVTGRPRPAEWSTDFRRVVGTFFSSLFGPGIYQTAAALVVLLVVSVAFLRADFSDIESYQTQVAQKRSFQLADGSRVRMNTDSMVEVDYSDDLRSIRLVKGQAFFDVAKDKNRPFVVKFTGGQVTALGTEFDVYVKEGQTQVTLLEGRVQVEHQNNALEATDTENDSEAKKDVILSYVDRAIQVKINAGKISPVAKVDAKIALAWLSDKLVIDNQPLIDFVEELNRYSKKEIILEDYEMGNMLISGTFSTDIYETLKMLENYLDFQVEESADGTSIYIRKSKKDIEKYQL